MKVEMSKPPVADIKKKKKDSLESNDKTNRVSIPDSGFRHNMLTVPKKKKNL